MDFKEEWNWLNSYQMEAVTDENDACIVNCQCRKWEDDRTDRENFIFAL